MGDIGCAGGDDVQERKTCLAALELCGAMIGAGFATGREVASFFSQFGPWSWLGVAAGTGTIALLGKALARGCARRGVENLAVCFPGAWGWISRGAFLLLLFTTGGAMTAGAAELAELTLPLQGAGWLGGAGTLGLCWMMARGKLPALTVLSGALMVVLTALMGLCWLLPPTQGFSLTAASPTWPALAACVRGVCWGGFNLAFAAPLVCRRTALPHAPICAAGLLALLLALGNGLMLRHPALWNHPLPMAALFSALGKSGYVLGVAALYLAILTTLIAVFQGLGEMLPRALVWRDGLALVGVAGIATVSFQGIVGVGYPLLGALCLCILGAVAVGCRN